jgi:hypothetical protein
MTRTKFKCRRDKVAKEAFLEKKKRKREEREQGGSDDQSSNGPPGKKRDTKNKTTSLPTQAPAKDDEESLISIGRSAEVPATKLLQRPAPTNDDFTTDQNPLSTSFQTPPLPAELLNAYDITTVNIVSSSSINKKATRALEVLGTYPVDKSRGEKEKVVVLQAKAKVASKMVSVVEICKREVGKEGGKWFQYNAVGEVRGKFEGKEGGGKGVEKGVGGDSEAAEEAVESEDKDKDEEESFETMKTPFERTIEGKPKVRAVPVMTVYLSRVRIDSLRKAHGEQTNGLKKS